MLLPCRKEIEMKKRIISIEHFNKKEQNAIKRLTACLIRDMKDNVELEA